jgi:mono/diheme cytochrome c family protein
MIRKLAFLWVTAASLEAATIAADSTRGAHLFETLSCVQCHSINGKGGTVAPDLGRRVDRNFTPATLAATMWNHAPTMWAAMRERNILSGDLNDQAAADLFRLLLFRPLFRKTGRRRSGQETVRIETLL